MKALLWRITQCTGRITIPNKSLESHQKVFFSPIQLFIPVLQNTSETYSMACNQEKAFSAKKNNTDGVRVNLLRKRQTEEKKANNSTLICGLMVGIGVMVLEMRGYCVGVFRCFSISPPRKSTGDPVRELHYTVEGTNTSSRRLFLRLQETLLPFLGAAGMNFTHTLSCLNCTRNLLQ